VLWSFPPPAAPGTQRRPLRNCPIVDAQGKILACLQDRLIALNLDGKPAWSYVTGGAIPGSPALGSDGIARIHSSDGFLHGVAGDGGRAWTSAGVGEPLGRSTPLVDGTGMTWISAAKGGLLRVDAEGRLLDKRPFYRCGCQLNATGLIHQGVLYIGGDDHCVHAISLAAAPGRNLWEDDGTGRGRTGWYINAAIALGPGPTLVAVSFDQHVHAFHPDGTRAWCVALPGLVRGSPVIAPAGQIIVGVCLPDRGGGEKGALVSVDPGTGSVRVLSGVEAAVESTPVVGDDGVVYFGDNTGTVRAVDLLGNPRWSETLGSPVRSPGTLVAPGVIVFGRDDGILSALGCSSQALARGGWPKYLGGVP
jgi:outer membrane protein assembly factor BamB